MTSRGISAGGQESSAVEINVDERTITRLPIGDVERCLQYERGEKERLLDELSRREMEVIGLRQRIAELEAQMEAGKLELNRLHQDRITLEAELARCKARYEHWFIEATDARGKLDSARRAIAAWKRAAVARRARDELSSMSWSVYDSARYDRLESILRKAEAGTQ